MLETLQHIDVEILVWINNTFKSDWMDAVMLFCSGKLTWVPFYAILLFFLYKSDPKPKRVLINLLILTCCIALADQLASGLLKPLVARLRPCHNDDVNIKLVLIDGICGGRYGFVSSHAANVFAVFFFFYLKKVFQSYNVLIYVLFVWATIVSLSRVYLGVHYPGDIFFGALVGIAATFVVVSVERIIEQQYYKK